MGKNNKKDGSLFERAVVRFTDPFKEIFFKDSGRSSSSSSLSTNHIVTSKSPLEERQHLHDFLKQTSGFEVDEGSYGKIGPRTKKAIKEFQDRVGIKVDGIPGPVTLNAMKLVEENHGEIDDKIVAKAQDFQRDLQNRNNDAKKMVTSEMARTLQGNGGKETGHESGVLGKYLSRFGETKFDPVIGENAKSGHGAGCFCCRDKRPVAGASKHHVGTDFKGDFGDKVTAPFDAKVTKITHFYIDYVTPNGLAIRDAHVKPVKDLRVGSEVKAGQVTCVLANVGPLTGAHLHREYKDTVTGININPLLFHDKERADKQQIACDKHSKSDAKWYDKSGFEKLLLDKHPELVSNAPYSVGEGKTRIVSK